MVMAEIYTLIGEYEFAIDELEVVLSVPSWSSSAYLRAEPLFAPLRKFPQFQGMLEKYDREYGT
jgi:hypothetical protein